MLAVSAVVIVSVFAVLEFSILLFLLRTPTRRFTVRDREGPQDYWPRGNRR